MLKQKVLPLVLSRISLMLYRARLPKLHQKRQQQQLPLVTEHSMVALNTYFVFIKQPSALSNIFRFDIVSKD